MIDAKIDSKAFLITGGSKGVGRATAELFVQQGAAVAFSARDGDTGRAVAEEIEAQGPGRVFFFEGDAGEPEQVEAFVEASVDRFDKIAGIVANVGLMLTGSAPGTSLETWRKVVDVNLSSAFYLAKYGIPALARSGGGTAVLTAGELGLVGARETVAYCAAKGGLINLTRALAVDAAEDQIRVNCVCPGPIDTPLLREWYAGADDPAELERAQEDPVLLKRVATAEEVAMVNLIYSSWLSSYQTGSIVVVDGGLTSSYGL